MLNWSAWLRMHHQDPQWTEQVIKDASWDGLDFSTLSALEDWTSTANIEILDTTELDLKQVAANVSVWIKSEKLISKFSFFLLLQFDNKIPIKKVEIIFKFKSLTI